MAQTKRYFPLPPDERGVVPQTLSPQEGAGPDDHVPMSEAADFLLEDEDTVEGILARAGVALIREGNGTFVSRRDLQTYHARDRAARQIHLRALTRLSIEAGLDEADYSSLLPDPN